jgi:dual specificity MAP kinase phosphatase
MDISQITDNLYIGTTPDVEDYPFLRELGVKLVINMRFERPPKRDPHQNPLRFLWLPTFDNPLLPIPMHALRRGVRSALETMARGGQVYAHCAAGVHRSVAMAAAIMIAQGQSAENAMALIKTRRQIADPDIWYIRRRIERFAQMWESNHAS